VRFSPDGRWVGTLSRDGNFRLYEPHSGRLVTTVDGITAKAAFSFSPDSQKVVLGRQGGQLTLLDIQSGTLMTRPEILIEARATPLEFITPQSVLTTTESGDRSIIWDLSAGTSSSLDQPPSTSVMYLPKRNVLASTSSEQILLTDRSGKTKTIGRGAHSFDMLMTVSHDERYAFAATIKDVAISVVSLDTGERLLALPFAFFVASADISPDDRELAVATGSSVVIVPIDYDLLESLRSAPIRQLAESEELAGRHLRGFELVP
jgi:WD40 repeat protein